MRLTQRTESHFRETPDGMLLLATRPAGGAPPQFPPLEFMHGDAVVEALPIGPVGVLYTYSIVHLGRDKPPYGLAMVDFEPGVRVFGPLCFEPGQEPALGAAMKIVPHTLPDGQADYAFAALAQAAA
jgi:uncharacterized OB-fold protein